MADPPSKRTEIVARRNTKCIGPVDTIVDVGPNSGREAEEDPTKHKEKSPDGEGLLVL